MIETDGMLTPGAARRLRRATLQRRPRVQTAETGGTDWLVRYMSYLFDDEPAIARRPRMATRQPAAPSAPRLARSTELPFKFTAAVDAEKMPPQPGITTSSIMTGTVVPARPDAAKSPDANDALIVAAERYQARADLVKLEFASRTYDERKLSGQQVFELRHDWHVLERARDALTGAELATATASGFEANAYINETTRTIVVAVAGSQDLRRDFLAADVWHALIKSQAPQQFYMAKTYVRSVMQRYQMHGFSTECVGHSLGGGACAYAASELGIRALVVNPISAGSCL